MEFEKDKDNDQMFEQKQKDIDAAKVTAAWESPSGSARERRRSAAVEYGRDGVGVTDREGDKRGAVCVCDFGREK